MNNLACPYCGVTIDPDDRYDTATTYSHTCPHRERDFVFAVDYTIYPGNKNPLESDETSG